MRRTAPRQRPRSTGPGAATREIVYFRDGFLCVICSDDSGPFQVHHRRPRGAGGSSRPCSNSPANLLLLCAACHTGVESNRADARDHGWLLSQTADPATSPVLWRGRVVLLAHDGTSHPLPLDPWDAPCATPETRNP